MRIIRAAWAPALLIAIGIGIGIGAVGCTASMSSASPDREDRILGDFAGTKLSDFEKGVFADGVVSSAEYDEAYNLWKRCVNDNDVDVVDERNEFGLRQRIVSAPIERPQKEVSDIDMKCGVGTFDIVRNFYEDQVLNPDSRDWNEGVLDCLKEAKIIDPDATLKEYLTEDLIGSENAEASLPCTINPFGITPKS